MYFQELILRLQAYWSDQGCVILQPYDMEVGAGTFHTATFLTAVGPEPLSAAYVQPSRRPLPVHNRVKALTLNTALEERRRQTRDHTTHLIHGPDV